MCRRTMVLSTVDLVLFTVDTVQCSIDTVQNTVDNYFFCLSVRKEILNSSGGTK